jgi:hypothetical protein
MARDARATIIGRGTLLEAAGVTLVGRTALAVLVRAGGDRTSCPATIESQLVPDVVLRDMRLHD